MLKSVCSCVIGACVSLILGCGMASADVKSEVVVDFTNPTGKVNRAIWGIEGLPKVYMVGQQHPEVLDSLYRLNPTGWHARMETWIGYLEPENDNDDPNVFDWDRLHPEKMIRFIEDREAFEAWIGSLNVALMPLLCYGTEWLDSGDETDKIRDKAEWAEFAAAAMHSWNADGDDLRARYAEVWNEPNMPMFGLGDRAAFYELFNVAAERLRTDDPTVMVGGPALTPAYWAETDAWYAGFIEHCGTNADFVIHHIYHGSDVSVADEVAQIIEMTDMFRAVPGKSDGRMSLTEIDAWFDGWPKFQYMMQRHMGYHAIRDRLLSVHHFTTLAYNESNTHVFGVMTNQGAPLLGNYWSFWIMRNLDGDTVNVIRRGEAGVLDVVGSRDVNEAGAVRLATVFYNRTEAMVDAPVTMVFEPVDHDRVLRVDAVAEPDPYQGVVGVVRVKAGATRFEMPLQITGGSAVAVTLLDPGKRHVPIFDMNDQEGPAVTLVGEGVFEIETGDTFELRAMVTNTMLEPVEGVLRVEGLPAGWKVSGQEKRIALESPGDTVGMSVMVTATGEPAMLERMSTTEHSEMAHLNHAVAPVAVFVPDAGGERRVSLPVDLVFVKPSSDEKSSSDE